MRNIIMKLLYEKDSYKIRGIVYDIYKKYRNYHKESIYHNALYIDLVKSKFNVEKNKKISIYHNGEKIGTYVPDLIINDIIIIELKCKPIINLADRKQFWQYLKASKYQLGFLINFGTPNGVEIERKIFTKNKSSV